MPRAVYVLALGIFAMVMSEFAVAGLMPEIADGLDVSIPQVGYLITAYAVAMAVGGPALAAALLRLPPKSALMVLFGIFLAGNVLAAVAPGYGVMMVARVVAGAASQAFFGVAVTVAVQLVSPELRGRTVAAALNGLMLGTLLGLPLSSVVGQLLGWRAAFWVVAAVTVVAALCTVAGVPDSEPSGGGAVRPGLGAFRNPRLWLALSTSTLVIGATFSVFSYLNPILTEVSGFGAGAVPLLLVAYGAATVVGNTVVGRLADRFAVPVLLTGLALNLVFLTGFALLAHVPVLAVACMVGIGLVGVTMNPALVTRVQRAGNTGPLVNSVHGSFITVGVGIGSSVGGLLVSAYGLRAPLWLGAGLALLGIATVLPDLLRPSAPTLAGAGAPAERAVCAAPGSATN